MNTPIRRIALAGALLATSCLSAPAFAQTVSSGTGALRRTIDDNGVNLITGKPYLAKGSASVGAGDSEMSIVLGSEGSYNFANIYGFSYVGGSTLTVTIGGTDEVFTLVNGSWVPNEARGSSYSGNTYRTADGTAYVFTSKGPYQYSGQVLESVTRPNGEKVTYHYFTRQIVTGTWSNGHSGGPIYEYVHRLSSLTSSNGYQMQVDYQSDTLNTTADIQAWQAVRKWTVINNSVEACNYVMGGPCYLTNSWPSLEWSSSGGVTTVKDATNRTAQFTNGSYGPRPCAISAARPTTSPTATTRTAASPR